MSRIAQMYEFACRVVLLVLVVHIAFLVFSLAGLVILGVFPAFSATIATYRAWSALERQANLETLLPFLERRPRVGEYSRLSAHFDRRFSLRRLHAGQQ